MAVATSSGFSKARAIARGYNAECLGFIHRLQLLDGYSNDVLFTMHHSHRSTDHRTNLPSVLSLQAEAFTASNSSRIFRTPSRLPLIPNYYCSCCKFTELGGVRGMVWLI